MLMNIFEEFKISKKVQMVVTDNATNFAKAFSLFEKDVEEPQSISSNSDNNDEECAVIIGSVEEQLLKAINDNDTTSDIEENMDVVALPPHARCGNHTLNLVAASDSLKARKDKIYQRNYDRAMGKVQALSNALSRSSKLNDKFEEITKKTFLRSTCTRWWSEYYCIERVVEIGLDKIVECQNEFSLNPMSQGDMRFLEAFLSVMKPLVLAMKILEGETDTYLGQVVPTIMGLERKLNMCTDPLVKPLALAMLDGLKLRFGPIKAKKEYLIATMLHPKFKLNFLSDNEKIQHQHILNEYITAVHQETVDAATVPISSSSSSTSITDGENDDLYSFLSEKSFSHALVNDQVSSLLLPFVINFFCKSLTSYRMTFTKNTKSSL
jgi:ribosomal protein L44E